VSTGHAHTQGFLARHRPCRGEARPHRLPGQRRAEGVLGCPSPGSRPW
jgi:hypothetical protein